MENVTSRLSIISLGFDGKPGTSFPGIANSKPLPTIRTYTKETFFCPHIGGAADYTSFLALSQLASIVNMMVPNCPATAHEMSQNDLAFLRGLYQMPLDGNLRMQKDGIGYEMTKALQGR